MSNWISIIHKSLPTSYELPVRMIYDQKAAVLLDIA